MSVEELQRDGAVGRFYHVESRFLEREADDLPKIVSSSTTRMAHVLLVLYE